MRPFDRPLHPSLRIVAAMVVAVAAAAAAPAGSTTPAGDPAIPLPCPHPSQPVPAPGLARSATSAAGGWWRLTPRLDVTGELAGQRLVAGSVDGRRFRMNLPPESFAAGPVAGRVLVGADDGRASRLTMLDLDAGCTIAVATEASVIRRAMLDRAGSAILEFRVDRATRADLGVWRRPISPSGAVPASSSVMAPIAADGRFGVTWTTDLGWSDDGRLVVTSCGAVACRTRLLAPATGETLTIGEQDLGPTIGVADGALVSYLACRGRPCPVVATDLRDGRRRILATSAISAALVADPYGDGTAVVHQSGHQPGHLLRTAVADGSTVELPVHVDRGLVGAGGDPIEGVELPAGWLALGRGDGVTVPDSTDARPPDLLRARDGRRTTALEVIR